MPSLYIIGNGFDLFNGLKTCYSDFNKFVIKYHSELENQIEEYFSFQVDKDYLWKDFENDLASFNFRNLLDNFNNIDTNSDSFKPSEFYGLEDEMNEEVDLLIQKIKDAFTDWIEEIVFPESPEKSLPGKNQSFFINFNYTDTLEVMYRVPKQNILYIHNNANDYSGDLIFGHGQATESEPKPDTFDENGEPTRTMLTDSEDAARYPFYAFIKDTEDVIKTHVSYFDKLENIDSIIVLGHSLGQVDWPYFKEIRQRLPDLTWKISYYGEEEKARLKLIAMEMLEATETEIEMIKIDEL